MLSAQHSSSILTATAAAAALQTALPAQQVNHPPHLLQDLAHLAIQLDHNVHRTHPTEAQVSQSTPHLLQDLAHLATRPELTTEGQNPN